MTDCIWCGPLDQLSDELAPGARITSRQYHERHSAPVVCSNADHDHTTLTGPEGEQLAEPVAAVCPDCGCSSLWDESIQQYQHADPAAADCFLIGRRGGSACQ